MEAYVADHWPQAITPDDHRPYQPSLRFRVIAHFPEADMKPPFVVLIGPSTWKSQAANPFCYERTASQ
jgi:hypothetical protein